MINNIILGLGNPGPEYIKSRHSVGRMVVDLLVDKLGNEEWKLNKKIKSLESKVMVGQGKKAKEILLAKPETFMNKSGQVAAVYVSGPLARKKLIVVYDDVDLPLGKIRFSFGRGSGGHRGLESIIRSLKSKDFIRLRVGIAPSTPSGKVKKPPSDKVVDFVIGDFKPAEEKVLKKVLGEAVEALVYLVENGLDKAMNEYNK